MRTKQILPIILVSCLVTTLGQLWKSTSALNRADAGATRAPDLNHAENAPASVSRIRSINSTYRSRVETKSVAAYGSDEVTDSLLKRIFQALDSPDPVERENALSTLLPELVNHDAHAASVLAEMNTSPEMREEVLRRVARLWSAQDADGAFTWAAGLADADERDIVLSDICLQLAQTNPWEAVAIRERYRLDDRPDPVLTNVAQQWAEKDLPAALAWASARPAGEERDQVIARLAFVESQIAPSDAARLVLEQIPPGDAQAEAVMTVLHQWAGTGYRQAAAWVDQFPASPLKQRAVQELAAMANTSAQSVAR